MGVRRAQSARRGAHPFWGFSSISLTVGTNVRVLQEVKREALENLTGARGARTQNGRKLQNWTKNSREN